MTLAIGIGISISLGGLPFTVSAPEESSTPANVVAPVVSGTEQVSSILSCTQGTWTGSPTPVLTYQWDADDVVIAGATANTYTLTANEETKVVKCVVTATNSEGNASADGNDTGAITAAPAGSITLLGAGDLDALALDFVQSLVTIRDVGTPGNDVNNAAINASLTFTGATKIIVAQSGILKTRAANTLEQSYDPEFPGPGAIAIGTLLEPAEASIHLHARAADNAAWVKTGVDVPTTNNSDPMGTTVADEVAATATADAVRTIAQAYTSLTAGEVTTVSRFVKIGTNINFVQLVWDADGAGTDGCYCNFNLTTGARGQPQVFAAGVVKTARIVMYPDGWWRVEVTGAIAAGTVGEFSVNLIDNIDAAGFEAGNWVNNDSVLVDYAQVGPGTQVAGSPIDSTTTPVTRVADPAPSIPYVDFPYANTAPGVIAMRYWLLEDAGGDSNLWAIGNSATEELALEQYDGVQHRFSVIDGGVQQALIADGPGAGAFFGDVFIIAGWGTNDAFVKCDLGMPGGTDDTTVTLPTTAGTDLHIGGDSAGVAASIFLKELVYLARKPSNTHIETAADNVLPFPAAGELDSPALNEGITNPLKQDGSSLPLKVS